MKDVALWHNLLKHCSPSPTELPAGVPEMTPDQLARELERLAELNAVTDVERAQMPLQGMLLHLLQKSTSLPLSRPTLLSALGGATGQNVWKELVHTLDQAALDALRLSCAHDPDRWIHALFHSDAAVRNAALERPPAHFNRGLLLHLLGDEHNRDHVLEQVLPTLTGIDHAGLLIHFISGGDLTLQEAADHLQALPWHLSLGDILAQLPWWMRTLEPGIDHGADLVDWYQARSAGADAFDIVVAIFFGEPADSLPHEQADDVRDRIFWGLQNSDPECSRRVGRCAIRVAARDGWKPSLLHLAALALPHSALLDARIPLTERKSAARELLNYCGTARFVDDVIVSLLSGDVCLHDDDLPDLGTICGVLKLAHEGPFASLTNAHDLEALAQGFWRNPMEAADILTLPAPSGSENKVQKQLLDRIFTTPAARVTPEVLARLALVARHEGIHFLRELHRFGPNTVLDVIRALLDLSEEESLTRDRIEKLATILAGQCGKRRLQDALERIGRFEHAATNPLAYELLVELGRETREKTFKAAFMALEVAVMRTLLDLIVSGNRFPYGVEKKLVSALSDHENEDIRERVQALVATPEERRNKLLRVSQEVAPLTDEEFQTVAHCRALDLGQALDVCFTQPRTRVCEALAERSSAGPDEAVAAAILASHDPWAQVVVQLSRYTSPEPDFRQRLDELLVERCAHSSPGSLLGNAWLHLWEQRLEEFGQQIAKPKTWSALGVEHADGPVVRRDLQVERSLALALRTDHPGARDGVWSATAHLIKRAFWRERSVAHRFLNPTTLDLAAAVLVWHVADEPSDALPEDAVLDEPATESMAEWAACILQVAAELGAEPETMQRLRALVLGYLSEMSETIRDRLRSWVDARGMSVVVRITTREASRSALKEVRESVDLNWLAGLCRGDNEALAEEAALRLSELGEDGRTAVLNLLREAPPCTRSLSIVVALWPHCPSLQDARDLVEDLEALPFVRFHVGCALLERGENAEDAVLDTVNQEPPGVQWLRGRDWEKLQRLGIAEERLCDVLVVSPQSAAYGRAVPMLLQRNALNGLRAFLCAGHDRMRSLREEVAWHLHRQGDHVGFPVLVGSVFHRSQGQLDRRQEMLLDGVPRAWVDTVIDAVIAGGDARTPVHHLVAMMENCPGVPSISKRRAFRLVAKNSENPNLQHRALGYLSSGLARFRDVERVAQVFQWGVKLGRELTSELFGIEMIGGGDLGYTRLNEKKIYVNPLPMLRGEQDGETVVRALIAHELGHHLYHASPEGIALWKQSAKDGVQKLFNLVLDEHLERNLRARKETVGNSLKTLAAYGFQHNTREVAVARLLSQLSRNAFSMLCTPDNRGLQVARKKGHVRVEVGRVFGQMESGGLSFGRFVRALRMGLGNRHGDPKVEEGLALFGTAFRKSSMQDLYDITLKLREIFGAETDILGCMGQDAIFEPSDSDLARDGKGITNEEIQKAVERISNPKSRDREARSGRERGGLWINVSADADFNPIRNVVPVRFDRTQASELAKPVLRHARRMRRYLQGLGLAMVPQRARLHGRSLDRSRIPAMVIKGDPRVLIAREVQQTTDLFVGLVVDCSGSMSSGNNMLKAKRYAALLAEACRGLRGVDVRIFGFTDSVIYDAGDADRCAAHGLTDGGGNNDAAGLWHAAQEALRSRRKARLLVMISDGLPTECSVAALRNLVQFLSHRKGISCAQVAVRPLEEQCFEHYIEVTTNDLDMSVRRFGEIVSRLVRGALTR